MNHDPADREMACVDIEYDNGDDNGDDQVKLRDRSVVRIYT